MPLYEYKCNQCGQVFEVIQRFSDEPLTQHEGCGGAVARLLSAPALQFKGSGWYITDYSKSGSGTNGKSKESAPAETSSSSEKKSDSGATTTTSTTTTTSSSDKK